MDTLTILKLLTLSSALCVVITMFNIWLSYTEIYIKVIRFINWFKFIMSIIITIVMLIILISR